MTKLEFYAAVSLISIAALFAGCNSKTEEPPMVEPEVVEELRPAPEQVEIFEPIEVEPQKSGVVLRREYQRDGHTFMTEERNFDSIAACERHREEHKITSPDMEIVETCQ